MDLDSMGARKHHTFDGFGRIVREKYATHGPKVKKEIDQKRKEDEKDGT